jgi:hypothetical protein
MDEAGLRAEITEGWSDVASPPRLAVVDMLVALSLIAWRSLAGHPSAEELVVIKDIGGQLGSRSTKPRTVLRQLIQFAEADLGWTPTPSVLRAAGRKVPTPQA